MELHKLLKRQLNRSGLDTENIPATADAWHDFLKHISRSYIEADQDRYIVERSLEISSKEMSEVYAELANEREKLQAALSEGAIFLDVKWQVKSANEMAENILGQPEEQLRNKHY